MGWKMVRDGHRDVLADHISGSWRTAPDPVSSLVKKLGEEYSELNEGRDWAELYDLLDVLRELIAITDPDGKYQQAHQRKTDRMGGFSAHLEWHPNPQLGQDWSDSDLVYAGIDTLAKDGADDGERTESTAARSQMRAQAALRDRV